MICSKVRVIFDRSRVTDCQMQNPLVCLVSKLASCMYEKAVSRLPLYPAAVSPSERLMFDFSSCKLELSYSVHVPRCRGSSSTMAVKLKLVRNCLSTAQRLTASKLRHECSTSMTSFARSSSERRPHTSGVISALHCKAWLISRCIRFTVHGPTIRLCRIALMQ